MAFTGKLPAPESRAATAESPGRGADVRNLHLLILLVFVTGVFGYTTAFDFVWDDGVLLVGVDAYERFDLKRMFFALANQVEYLPVRDVSYALDYALWGENPFGFHLTNLVLYYLNAVLVYRMSLQLTPRLFSAGRAMDPGKTRAVALFTALLFAVHPVHSEAVSFISCRNVLLSGLFFFMSCSFFLTYLGRTGGNRRTFYAASLLCCALAIFSKATAVVLPGVLLLIAAFDRRPWRQTYPALVPFVAVSVAAVILFRAVATQTGLINPDQVIAFGSRSVAARLAVALQIPFFYLGKLTLPVGLSALYDTWFASDLGDPRVLLAAFALVAAAAAGIRLRTRFPEVLFALGWYLVALFPVLNFFATGTVVSDRYAYLASYAFAYLVATTLALIRPTIPAIAIRSVAAAAIVALSFSAFVRNGVWRSNETLWTDTIRVSPDGRTAYYNLGVDYFSRGEHAKAFRLFERFAERLRSVGEHPEGGRALRDRIAEGRWPRRGGGNPRRERSTREIAGEDLTAVRGTATRGARESSGSERPGQAGYRPRTGGPVRRGAPPLRGAVPTGRGQLDSLLQHGQRVPEAREVRRSGRQLREERCDEPEPPRYLQQPRRGPEEAAGLRRRHPRFRHGDAARPGFRERPVQSGGALLSPGGPGERYAALRSRRAVLSRAEEPGGSVSQGLAVAAAARIRCQPSADAGIRLSDITRSAKNGAQYSSGLCILP
jgi:hypothetical protein